MKTKIGSRNWDNWKNLTEDELQARREILLQRDERVSEREKEVQVRDDEVWAEKQRVKAKSQLIDDLIERISLANKADPADFVKVLRSDFKSLMGLKTYDPDDEKVEVPVFSEAGLYDRFGKDSARSILHYMRSLGMDLGMPQEDLP